MTESFAALLDESLSTLDMQPGSIVSGVVLDVDNDWVTVHVGLKSEGVVSLDEFRNNEGEVSIAVGDEVEVALEAVEDGYGETRISREKARKISTWKMLEDALESGEFVTGKIHNRVKGGFAVEVEVVKAFLPGSLVDVRPLKEAPDIEHTVQEFKVIKLDYKRNNVVLSRKAVLEKNNSAVKVELLKNLEEGQIVKGIVKNITDYGAFVDLGGLDGLLHITDISWSRVSNPAEFLSLGDEIDVKILSFDKVLIMVCVLKRIIFKLHLFSPMSWNSTFEPRSYCAPYLEIHRRSIQLYLYTKTFWKIETANAIFPEGFAIYNTIFLSGKITVWSLRGAYNF